MKKFFQSKGFIVSSLALLCKSGHTHKGRQEKRRDSFEF